MDAAVFTAFATGFGLGFLVAAQVGPISLICVRSVLRRRLLTGLSIGAGAAVIDVTYAALRVVGATQLLRITQVRLTDILVERPWLIELPTMAVRRRICRARSNRGSASAARPSSR